MIASVRAEYGLGIRAVGLLELAELVDHLPPGCALFRAVGGPAAWSPEEALLHGIEYRLRVLAWMQSKDGQENRNRPDPPEPPKRAGAVRAEEAHASKQAAARRRRQSRGR